MKEGRRTKVHPLDMCVPQIIDWIILLKEGKGYMIALPRPEGAAYSIRIYTATLDIALRNRGRLKLFPAFSFTLFLP
jgi:hypothetical protein